VFVTTRQPEKKDRRGRPSFSLSLQRIEIFYFPKQSRTIETAVVYIEPIFSLRYAVALWLLFFFLLFVFLPFEGEKKIGRNKNPEPYRQTGEEKTGYKTLTDFATFSLYSFLSFIPT
jgi:hypothetical protein